MPSKPPCLKPLNLFCFLFAFCLNGHCADASVGASATAAVQTQVANDAVPRRGTLYRIRYKGKTSYLFGTVHAGKKDFFPLEPEVNQALAKASKLVIELDIRENRPFQTALDKHGFYPPGDSIRNHLSPEAFGKLRLALFKAGLDIGAVGHYKPWLVANLLVGQELEQHGFERSQAVEFYLLEAAQKQAKKVLELESADYQLSLFDTMDDRQQERYMLENLADLDDGDSLRKSEGLIDAWSTADARKIDALMHDLTTGDTVSSNFIRRTLLGKRNPEMATTIENIMKDDQVAFVGVGLLHLIGRNGLPQLLMQRGYDVEKVY
ncbi:MAG TPA: TraB/GumN family protein [Janthinobacterium sp.]|nr:TraB/GumN family protein [Janthinobacterium sp.]